MIRVLVVDDQAVVSEGLKVILNASPSIEVVATAANGAEAVDLVEHLRPDLVLMDLKMPIMNGIRATEVLRAKYPEIAVLVLTTYDDDEWVIDAIRAGASGYLLKDSEREAIVAAIEGTHAGRTYLDPSIAGKVISAARHGTPLPPPTREPLTEREQDILRLLASGLTNAAIADKLYLAEGTIRNHITTLFAKLDVTDRAQATAFAWRYGLVRPADHDTE